MVPLLLVPFWPLESVPVLVRLPLLRRLLLPPHPDSVHLRSQVCQLIGHLIAMQPRVQGTIDLLHGGLAFLQ